MCHRHHLPLSFPFSFFFNCCFVYNLLHNGDFVVVVACATVPSAFVTHQQIHQGTHGLLHFVNDCFRVPLTQNRILRQKSVFQKNFIIVILEELARTVSSLRMRSRPGRVLQSSKSVSRSKCCNRGSCSRCLLTGRSFKYGGS